MKSIDISSYSYVEIVPENTADPGKVSQSTKKLMKFVPPPALILDYGAGLLQNTRFLMENGYCVDMVETPEQIRRIKHRNQMLMGRLFSTSSIINQQYDAILCSFVLNVIPLLEDRYVVLERIFTLLKKDGVLSLEVSKARNEECNQEEIPFEDGVVLGSGKIRTFEKTYEQDEIRFFVQQFGFVIEKQMFTSDSYIILARKADDLNPQKMIMTHTSIPQVEQIELICV